MHVIVVVLTLFLMHPEDGQPPVLTLSAVCEQMNDDDCLAAGNEARQKLMDANPNKLRDVEVNVVDVDRKENA